MRTVLAAKYELEGPPGFLAGREGNVLELAVLVCDLTLCIRLAAPCAWPL